MLNPVENHSKQIREMFLALTSYTCPYGYEQILYDPMFEELGVRPDADGNYRITVGENSKTLFLAHLDTADYYPRKVKHVFEGSNVKTDGTSILGADDRSGVCILLYLIHQGVPGYYYFMVGEERGLVGATAAHERYTDWDYFDRAIEFDRRGKTSIITHQMMDRTASDVFAWALADQLNAHGFDFEPDDGGSYTDSSEFSPDIPECTNISVGYQGAHTNNETQDLDFLCRLAMAAAQVDWESLPTKRDPKDVDTAPYPYFLSKWDEDYWRTDPKPITKADDGGASELLELVRFEGNRTDKEIAEWVYEYPDTASEVIGYMAIMAYPELKECLHVLIGEGS